MIWSIVSVGVVAFTGIIDEEFFRAESELNFFCEA